MSEQSFNEAPASATARMTSPNGVEWLLTVRSEKVSEIVDKAAYLEDYLLNHGWQAAGGRRSGPVATANGNGPVNGDAPTCQFHGPMKRSTKFDGWFCSSKMGDGSYCKEEVKD